ncbi:MAG: type II toxin-antitoxin system RelE/ParE family toxin [Bacteroidales bacterium]|nr:type II toxin-antitoxin system RelE/ParE family toxin [Bacteroidales bacterium]
MQKPYESNLVAVGKKQLRIVVAYLHKEFGPSVKKSFLREVHNANTLIGQNPQIGKVEPLLDELPDLYRSFVISRMDKIVYYVVENHIEVVAFWDCRREPERLVSEVK